MAIGVSIQQLSRRILLITLAFALLALPSGAADQIKKKDGTVFTGQIVDVVGDGANKQIVVSTPLGRANYYLSDVQSIDMAPPAAVAQVKGAAPAAVIAALEPVIKTYAGLPADWVVEAMAQLAEAYSASGKADLATATYTQIGALYPGSKYITQAVAGRAQLLLQQGKVDDALSTVQPLIDEANKNIAPSQSEGGLYASAFLVYGQALEAQKKLSQALEAYLTVKTMFYQNPDLAERADQMAKKLRDQNPGLSVD